MRLFVNILFALPIILFLTSCADDKIIDESNLPAEAITYIQTNFDGGVVNQAMKSQDGLSKNYDVYLNNGISLEFTGKGEVESIKSTDRLPDKVIPTKVLDYISLKHPSEFITQWEMNSNEQEVKLPNGFELKFNKDGEFIRMDM
ncbi:MAG TPA: PepSY-like domain-containing protein [Sphingobacteriaceae bacterium]|nr:PepSY-like domain-containing protein [Sphingobacteriaceae bacterium]